MKTLTIYVQRESATKILSAKIFGNLFVLVMTRFELPLNKIKRKKFVQKTALR